MAERFGGEIRIHDSAPPDQKQRIEQERQMHARLVGEVLGSHSWEAWSFICTRCGISKERALAGMLPCR